MTSLLRPKCESTFCSQNGTGEARTYSQVADETWRSNAKAKTTIMSNLYEIHTRPFKTGNPTGITFKPLLTYHPAPLKNGACMRPRPYVG